VNRARGASLALVLTGLLLPAPAAAAGHRHPSADELWRDYPLAPATDASPTPAPSPTVAAGVPAAPAPSPAAAAHPRVTAARPPAPGDRSGGGLLWVPFAVGAIAVAGGALLVALRSRLPAPLAHPPSLREPPDPARPWEAAIEWRGTPDGARFCIVARSGGASVVLAESEAVPWPPRSEDAVRGLAGAPDALVAAFVAAGWTPLPAGDAWYARRLAWRPPGAHGPRRGRPHLAAVSSGSIGRRSPRTHDDPRGGR
jgi:hypothetical protein